MADGDALRNGQWQLVTRSCPKASRKQLLASARAKSNVNNVEPYNLNRPLPVLTIVRPPKYVTSVAHELQMRSAAAGIGKEWMLNKLQSVWHSNYADAAAWNYDNTPKYRRRWIEKPLLIITGWHFRGVSEKAAVVMSDAIIRRIEAGSPTIVGLSAHPSYLRPRWHCDRPLIDAFLSAPLQVVVRPPPTRRP